VEQFGESGSGPEVLHRRGIHLDAVIAAAHATSRRNPARHLADYDQDDPSQACRRASSAEPASTNTDGAV